MQSIRTTRGAKRVYAAPCNAGYEIFSEREVWKAAVKSRSSFDGQPQEMQCRTVLIFKMIDKLPTFRR